MAADALPVILVTVFWGLAGVAFPFLIPKGPNKGLMGTLAAVTSACCWLFWLCAYLCQINPLEGPQISTPLLAVLQREWPHP